MTQHKNDGLLDLNRHDTVDVKPIRNGNTLSSAAHRRQRTVGQETAEEVKYFGHREISVKEFYDLPDHPRQRDTEGRAMNAAWLHKYHPVQARVNVAFLPDGRRYKVDGHTRCFLWSNGLVDGPETVIADVWRCRTYQALLDLYSTFDNPQAAERLTDQIFGAKRELGMLDVKSELIRSNRISAALRCATRFLLDQVQSKHFTPYDLLRAWSEEVRLLDSIDPSRVRFVSGVAAAALLSIARYDDAALPFWEQYSKAAGTKTPTHVDAVEALTMRILAMKGTKQISGSSGIDQLRDYSLAAFEAWRNGFKYVRSGNGTNLRMVSDPWKENFAAAIQEKKKLQPVLVPEQNGR